MAARICYRRAITSKFKDEVMAAGTTPHFHNEMGVPAIEIGAKEFMCIGAKPPFDHPHIFIDMGAESDAVCPYCSTRYKFNPSVAAGDANPLSAVWNGQLA
jgi:uncharacterized Zn-finger protein